VNPSRFSVPAIETYSSTDDAIAFAVADRWPFFRFHQFVEYVFLDGSVDPPEMI